MSDIRCPHCGKPWFPPPAVGRAERTGDLAVGLVSIPICLGLIVVVLAVLKWAALFVAGGLP